MVDVCSSRLKSDHSIPESWPAWQLPHPPLLPEFGFQPTVFEGICILSSMQRDSTTCTEGTALTPRAGDTVEFSAVEIGNLG